MSKVKGGLALVVGLVAVLGVPGIARATLPGTNGVIAFVPWRTTQLWTMSPDGSNSHEVIADTGSDHAFAWSPDGTKLAYAATDSLNRSAIFTMNADGSGVREIVHVSSAWINDPQWSPDGKSLVYNCKGRGLCITVIGGGTRTVVHDWPNLDSPTDWTVDGKIYFLGGYGLEWVRPSGGTVHNLIPSSDMVGTASISPGGKSIAVDLNTPTPGIYRVSTGTLAKHLIAAGWMAQPEWSPDGKYIMLEGNDPNSNYGTWVMGYDGSNPHEIYTGTPNETPVWQPVP